MPKLMLQLPQQLGGLHQILFVPKFDEPTPIKPGKDPCLSQWIPPNSGTAPADAAATLSALGQGGRRDGQLAFRGRRGSLIWCIVWYTCFTTI